MCIVLVLSAYSLSVSTVNASRRLNYALFKQSRGKCPNIVTRAEWGADPPKATRPIVNPVPRVFIHHTETPECRTEAECKRLVKSIQYYHMHHRGWDDIGYNFLIGEDGNVYEGRGWKNVGAHARQWNPTSYGIAVIGNFTNKVPSTVALGSLKQLIECGQPQKLSSQYTLHGHRDGVCTTCPGDAFYNLIIGWPHYGGQLIPPCFHFTRKTV